MKILICIGSLKGSIDSALITKHLCDHLRSKINDVTVDSQSITDDGAGFLAIIQGFQQGQVPEIDSFDPLGNDMKGSYIVAEDRAFIDLATCSGMDCLAPDEIDPYLSSTYGTGVLIRDAIQKGAKSIILFVDTAASIDAATGILHALGIGFYDEHDRMIYPSAERLLDIAQIDIAKLRAFLHVDFRVVHDEDHYLLGESGAVYVDGPQKGLDTAEALEDIEEGMVHFSKIVLDEMDVDINAIPGGAAGGGVVAGLVGILKATPIKKMGFIMDLLQLEDRIRKADVIITGGGQSDDQSWSEKLVGEIIRYSKTQAKQLIIISEQPSDSFLNQVSPSSVKNFSLMDYTKDQEQNMKHLEKNIKLLLEDLTHFLMKSDQIDG